MVVLQKPAALGPTEKHTEYMKIKPLPPMEPIPEYILAPPPAGLGEQRGKRRATGTRPQAAENRIQKRRRQNKVAKESRRKNRK